MFHMGIAPYRSKRERVRARVRERVRERVRARPRPRLVARQDSALAPPITFDLSPRQSWYIKPPSAMQLSWTTTAAAALFTVKQMIRPDLGAFTLPCDVAQNIVNEFLINKGVRIILRGFLQRWMLSRFKFANTEDPITCERPKRVIEIVDWEKRTKYIYEAKPFFKNIMSQLTYQEWLFPLPLYPKNMLTNEPFTFDQLFSIQKQLIAAGMTHWIWAAFTDLKYNLIKLKTMFDMPLRNYILTEVFAKKRSDTITEVVLDFIEAEADTHDINLGIPYRILRWGLEHEFNHPYIETWRDLCFDYYDITTLNNRKKSLVAIRMKSQALLQMREMWKDLNARHSRFIQATLRNQTARVV